MAFLPSLRWCCRTTFFGAVAEPQRVAHFMRGELPYAGKGRPKEDIGLLAARRVWRQQAFEDEIVLTVAQRAERDRALDDLAGARIADRAAEAPAARGAVHPVDHVVAD